MAIRSSMESDLLTLQKGLAKHTVESARAFQSLEARLLNEMQALVEASAEVNRRKTLQVLEERLTKRDRSFGTEEYLLGDINSLSAMSLETQSVPDLFGSEINELKARLARETSERLAEQQKHFVEMQSIRSSILTACCKTGEENSFAELKQEMCDLRDMVAQEQSERALGHRSLRDLCGHLAESFSEKLAELKSEFATYSQGDGQGVGAGSEEIAQCQKLLQDHGSRLSALSERLMQVGFDAASLSEHLGQRCDVLERQLTNEVSNLESKLTHRSRGDLPEEFMRRQTQILEEHRDNLTSSFEALELKVRDDVEALRKNDCAPGLEDFQRQVWKTVEELTAEGRATKERLASQDAKQEALVGQLLQEKASRKAAFDELQNLLTDKQAVKSTSSSPSAEGSQGDKGIVDFIHQFAERHEQTLQGGLQEMNSRLDGVDAWLVQEKHNMDENVNSLQVALERALGSVEDNLGERIARVCAEHLNSHMHEAPKAANGVDTELIEQKLDGLRKLIVHHQEMLDNHSSIQDRLQQDYNRILQHNSSGASARDGLHPVSSLDRLVGSLQLSHMKPLRSASAAVLPGRPCSPASVSITPASVAEPRVMEPTSARPLQSATTSTTASNSNWSPGPMAKLPAALSAASSPEAPIVLPHSFSSGRM